MPPVNWLSILLSSLTPLILGFIWYHKSVFGTAWMKSVGLTEEDAKKANMAMIFGISLIMSFLMSMFLLPNVDGYGQEGAFDSFKHGAFHGTAIGFTIAMPVMVFNGLFEQRSWKNLAINTGFWVVSLALMGGILDAMNHWPNDLQIQ